MAVEQHSVTSEHHEAAKAGTVPYYEGAAKPGTPEAEAPAAAAESSEPQDDTTEKPVEEAAETEGDKPAEQLADDAPGADEAVSGLDYQGYFDEFSQSNDLSQESRSAILEKLPGVPPELLDVYIEGLRAQRALAEQSAYNIVGGQESYQSLTKWGAENLTPAEIAEYNSAVERGGESAKFAIQGLNARMRAGGAGHEPSLAHTSTPASGTPLIKSRAELMEKMRDPRWERDPAYRKQVEESLARSMQSPDYRTW